MAKHPRKRKKRRVYSSSPPPEVLRAYDYLQLAAGASVEARAEDWEDFLRKERGRQGK